MKKILLFLVVSSALLLTSCYKEPEKGLAKITILNSSEFRQPGVDVHLFGPAGSYIDLHRMTNQMGEVLYEHDPALEVILKIHATYTDDLNVFHEAWGIVRIVPDEEASETLVLNP